MTDAAVILSHTRRIRCTVFIYNFVLKNAPVFKARLCKHPCGRDVVLYHSVLLTLCAFQIYTVCEYSCSHLLRLMYYTTLFSQLCSCSQIGTFPHQVCLGVVRRPRKLNRPPLFEEEFLPGVEGVGGSLGTGVGATVNCLIVAHSLSCSAFSCSINIASSATRRFAATKSRDTSVWAFCQATTWSLSALVTYMQRRSAHLQHQQQSKMC